MLVRAWESYSAQKLGMALLCLACEPTVVGVSPPGDTHAFTPFRHAEAAYDYASPTAKLLSITALGLQSDGTIDTHADDSHRIQYEFLAKNDQGQTIQVKVEVLAPGKYEGGSNDAEGSTTTIVHQGMSRRVSGESSAVATKIQSWVSGLVGELGQSSLEDERWGRAVESPKCTAAQLRANISNHDVPNTARALATYERERGRGDNPYYRLSFPKLNHRTFEFDADCSLREADGPG